MNATNFQTEIEHNGIVYDVHVEVDVNVSRAGFEYGFGGQRQTETEVTVEVTDFGVRDEAGNEIEDKAILRALSPIVDDVAEMETERLAERMAA